MKKLLLVLVNLFVLNLFSVAEAAAPNAIPIKNIYCSLLGGCPYVQMYNRNKTKVIARYQPTAANYCDRGSMKTWIMGHPNNAYGAGFTNEDWQDLEIAKKKANYSFRWGCCYSSDAYNTICLN